MTTNTVAGVALPASALRLPTPADRPAVRALVAGVYPLIPDESCYFPAADFDKATWQEDALAFVETGRRFDLPVALERSRSGQGGHVWLFFEDAVRPRADSGPPERPFEHLVRPFEERRVAGIAFHVEMPAWLRGRRRQGLPAEDRAGEEAEQDHRTIRIRNATIALLGVLTVAASSGAIIATLARRSVQSENRARAQLSRVSTQQAVRLVEAGQPGFALAHLGGTLCGSRLARGWL